ncbi:MAG: SWIM zinc finger family protein [Candidatus Bathyarchaeia archaeon]
MSGIEKLVSKAKRLIADKRVVRIEPGTYQVVGDHGTYIVVKGVDNSYHCGCPGYLNKGFCSHALAVTLLANRARRNKGALKETKRSEIPPEVPLERIKSVFEVDTDVS